MTTFVTQCDDYLGQRTGKYEWRAVRYMSALGALQGMGLDNNDTLYDIGAGWTELDYTLRTQGNWRGRYIPIDGGIDGINLNYWIPPRDVQFAVCLEILEHLRHPEASVRKLQACVNKGIVVSVPNPRTVDVLGIDPTHVTVVTRQMLEGWGFRVEERMFYGGKFSNGEPDSLFGVWEA